MKSYTNLLSACYAGINNVDFIPQFDSNGAVIKTFCNEFVDSVASAMGCNELSGKLANDIIDFMSASPNWSPVPITNAQSMANLGSLIVAGEKAHVHGHVAIVIPGITTRSIHWAMQVPLCANVGKSVFIGKGLSWAFREPPDFFVWRPSL